jgi:hypothetical protein
MLSATTYAASDVEREAVEALLASHRENGTAASITRTDPGETGALRVEIIGRIGSLVWLVEEDGTIVDLNPLPGKAPEA